MEIMEIGVVLKQDEILLEEKFTANGRPQIVALPADPQAGTVTLQATYPAADLLAVKIDRQGNVTRMKAARNGSGGFVKTSQRVTVEGGQVLTETGTMHFLHLTPTGLVLFQLAVFERSGQFFVALESVKHADIVQEANGNVDVPGFRSDLKPAGWPQMVSFIRENHSTRDPQ